MANLLLPARKGEYQQKASTICTEIVQLWHPLLAEADTSHTFKIMWDI
jgi:hypothetical protein